MFVYIQCRRRRPGPPIDCILSFLFPAETDVLVPVLSQSTDVVVVNFSQQNATLTGQEEEGDVQLKVSYLYFVIF